jgi:hypothetical protein
MPSWSEAVSGLVFEITRIAGEYDKDAQECREPDEDAPEVIYDGGDPADACPIIGGRCITGSRPVSHRAAAR